ncbi:MAG: glycosyl hydrolase family 5 [Hyphomicrobium sp.]
MSRALLLAGAVCAMSATALLAPAQANPMSGLRTADPAAQSLILKTGPRYCWRWNAICRDRWGWGWRYRRCMRIHGC